MAQLDKSRVIFSKSQQRKFFEEIKIRINLSDHEIAKLVDISPRSFTDWKRGKNTIPFVALKTLCKKAKVSQPKNLVLKEKFWYAKIGAPLGGKAVHKIYGPQIGNPKYRLAKWRMWWNSIGKNNNSIIGKTKSFSMPKVCLDLAEFIGIMLGDGGMTKYQLSITLNKDTDKKYISYVESLIWRLFQVKPKRILKKNAKAIAIVISRKNLNEHLVSLGLRSGNKLKQNLDIPKWIMENIKYQKMCLRGLIDTDGSIFHEVHNIKGKKYAYARLNFVTASPLLAQSVFNILETYQLSPVMRRAGMAVQVENKQKIWQYFRTIGTSNPKHLARWRSYRA